MPVGGQRDPEQTRASLTEWLSRQIPGARQIAIENLVVPQSTGFSNETFLFDATWTEGPSGPSQRADSCSGTTPGVGSLPRIDVINQQYAREDPRGAQRRTGRDREVGGTERDVSALHFVMDRLYGQVPGDRPPYTVEGWFVDLTDSERRELNTDGLSAMTKVNRVDWRSLDFGYLDRREYGPLGRAQRLGYFEKYWQWARAGNPHPVADPAWDYLRENWPDEEPVELCWGDARPGNQMYANGRVVAVMDWEMVSLGNAVSDLGWWPSCSVSIPRAPALLCPAACSHETRPSRWGKTESDGAEHVDFYEIVAGFHFTLVMMRIVGMFKDLDPQSYTPVGDVYNPVSMLTAGMLGIELRVPGR